MEIIPPIPTEQKRPARWRWLAVLFGGVVLLSALFLFRPAPAPPLEVERSELVSREGLLYLGSATTPFSGVMVEKYPDGTVLSRSALSEGRLHGVSQGWHTNGQVQITEHFQRGISNGLRVKWRADGSKESEANILNGQLHGVFRRWHESGELAQEIQMAAGVPQGDSVAYYPSGYVKTLAYLKDGKVIKQEFWEDQEMKLAARQIEGRE